MKRIRFKFGPGAVAAAVLLTVCGTAPATIVEYDFAKSNGTQSAEATFTFSDESGSNTLDIALTNTMTTNDGPQWLTGLFFDIAGGPDLTNADAAGEMITLDSDGNQSAFSGATASQFWAFRQDLAAGELPFGQQQYGLGAAGFDVFGGSDMIEGGGPHPQPGGVEGGVLADIDNLDVPNGHTNKPFILGEAQFSFELPNGFDVANASVENVAFAFGSGFDEIVLVPVPPAVALGAFGLISLATVGVRRSFKRAA